MIEKGSDAEPQAKAPRDCQGRVDRLGQDPGRAGKCLFPGAAAGLLSTHFHGTKTLELPGALETKLCEMVTCGKAEELGEGTACVACRSLGFTDKPPFTLCI